MYSLLHKHITLFMWSTVWAPPPPAIMLLFHAW